MAILSRNQIVARSPLRRRRLSQRLTFWLFVLPALALFTVMMLYPLANMFHVSTLEWRGLLKPRTYTGLDNYDQMFDHPNFNDALHNTIVHILLALPGVIIPAFFIGYFLSYRPRGFRILRVIFFSPAMIAPPGQALIFLGLYLPDGIINQALEAVGLGGWTRVWLADPDTSLAAIIAVDFWAGIGFYSVLFFAVLSNIPDELYEAARLDGANEWHLMHRIAFPLTLDFIGVASMLHFMWLLLGTAQNVLLLTRGRPGTSSLTLGYYLYQQAFEIKQLGYSQAIGVFIFAFGLVGMFLLRYFTHRSYEY